MNVFVLEVGGRAEACFQQEEDANSYKTMLLTPKGAGGRGLAEHTILIKELEVHASFDAFIDHKRKADKGALLTRLTPYERQLLREELT